MTTKTGTVRVEVTGATHDALRARALELARQYFGDGYRLVVTPFDASPELVRGDGSVSAWVADVEVTALTETRIDDTPRDAATT